jgi:hypothetical protein
MKSAVHIVEGRSHYAAQADLKLKILLPLPPKCWITDVYHHDQLGQKYFLKNNYLRGKRERGKESNKEGVNLIKACCSYACCKCHKEISLYS